MLPGTIGITLGRNPDGVVRDLAARTRPLVGAPAALLAVVAIEVGLLVAWRTDALSGWVAGIAGFLVPFVAARLIERGPGEASASPTRSTTWSCWASTVP